MLISAALLGSLNSMARAEEKTPCTECHSEKAQGDHIHPAVSMGCDTCHSGVNASNIPHKFSSPKGLSEKGNALCLMCHEEAKFKKKHRHAAVDMGCTGCHDPHVSKNAKLLTFAESELCMGCHGKDMFSKKTRHTALEGGCTGCHNPHSADMPKLLKDKVPELCYTCHDETMYYGPTIHPPVAAGECLSCHTPHSSDKETLTVESTDRICFNCHSEKEYVKKPKDTGTVHPPVAAGLCLECHKPHISHNESLLFRRGNLICRKCHEDIEKKPHTVAGFSSAGHPVMGRKDLARPGKVHSCMSCHLPHNSEFPYLFRYAGSSAFDLCGYCHENKF